MAEEQAPAAPPAQGGKPGFFQKLRNSFEQHKQLYALGIAAGGLLLTYLIWKQGQNGTAGTNTLVTGSGSGSGTGTDATGTSAPTITTGTPTTTTSTSPGTPGFPLPVPTTIVPPTNNPGPVNTPAPVKNPGTSYTGTGPIKPQSTLISAGLSTGFAPTFALSTASLISNTGVPGPGHSTQVQTLSKVLTPVKAAPLAAIAARPASPSVLKATTKPASKPAVKAVTFKQVGSLTPIKSSGETSVMPPRIGGYHAA